MNRLYLSSQYVRYYKRCYKFQKEVMWLITLFTICLCRIYFSGFSFNDYFIRLFTVRSVHAEDYLDENEKKSVELYLLGTRIHK